MSQIDKIREIVENTDEHRNRARRESWDAIKAVLAEPADAEPDDEDEITPPPLNGPGSGTQAWLEYATAIGVEVPEGATKGEIVAAIEGAGEEDEEDDAEPDDEDED